MYPQDISFVRERQHSRLNPPPLRLDHQFSAQPVNYYSSQNNTSRSQVNSEYSFISPATYTPVDRSMISLKPTTHDYGQEPVRVFRQPPGMSNFAPIGNMPNTPGPIKVYHNRSGSQAVGRPGLPNTLSLSHNPSSFNPMNFPGQFGGVPARERIYTQHDRPPGHREDKVLQFLERQNAVIEKLAIRIQQEERESIQRDKRELEQKLRDLQTEKILRQQEESLRILPKLNTDESFVHKDKEPEKPKESKKSANALETIGKFYLMSKLMEGKHKRSVSDPNAQRLLKTPSHKDRQRDNSLLKDGESLERSPTMPSKDLLKLGKGGNLIQHVLLHPLMLDGLDGGEYEGIPMSSRRSMLQRAKGNSARDLMSGRTPKVRYDRGIRTGENSFEEEDLMEEEYQPVKEPRKSLRVREKSTKNLKTPKADKGDAKAKKAKKAEEEAAAAAAEEEEKRKKQEKRKKEMQGKLRSFLWCINYPHCLFQDVRKSVESRKEEIQKKMSGNIQMNFEAAQNFLLLVGEKFLKEMVLESKQLDLYSAKKQFSEGDLNARTTIIFNYLKGLFDKMIVGTTLANLPKNLVRFLVSISEDSGVLPHNFMFDFEVKRLQFTYYATLKYQSPLKSKMVIGLFILLRVLLHKIIMRPWTVIPGLKKDKIKMNNLLTIGSVLYHTVLDFFRGNVIIVPNNQNFLPTELKVKPRSVPLEAMETPPDVDEQAVLTKKDESKSKEIEPITGFLTKDQLKCLFVDRKKMYDQLKALVDGWLEKIYQLTHTIYLNTPKEERETMGIPI